MRKLDFIDEKIANRETVILDGATGTELERRGVAMNSAAWSAEAILGSPEVVRVVHEDYIRAGADIITSNSFSLARHMLVRAGLEGQFRRLNADAVKIALKAREGANRPVAVAGSIAPTTFCDDPNLCYPPSADAFAWYREQAEVLAEAGADLLIIEMIEDIRQGSMAVEAALQTGLPVWLGFSCVKNAAGEMMLWEQGHTLREGVEAIAQIGGDAAFIMHTETKDAAEAFAILKSRWQGRIGVYAHSGVFVMPNWLFTDVITPEEYAAEAAKWIEMGAQIVGGCCGIGPEHIRRLQALSA